MAAKPGIPKGTRDFSPVEMAKRNYIFNTIRDVFHLFGYQQIETPSMENLSTLMGKYGDEGDKLLFKIQNSGDYFSGITDEELLSRNAVKLASKFCEKGLRYDHNEVFIRDYLIQQDGKYKGSPLRTHGGRTWLNGYSAHLPTIIYLRK